VIFIAMFSVDKALRAASDRLFSRTDAAPEKVVTMGR
jgi:hypothetical protein